LTSPEILADYIRTRLGEEHDISERLAELRTADVADVMNQLTLTDATEGPQAPPRTARGRGLQRTDSPPPQRHLRAG
jgi:hypothetical protein